MESEGGGVWGGDLDELQHSDRTKSIIDFNSCIIAKKQFRLCHARNKHTQVIKSITTMDGGLISVRKSASWNDTGARVDDGKDVGEGCNGKEDV